MPIIVLFKFNWIQSTNPSNSYSQNVDRICQKKFNKHNPIKHIKGLTKKTHYDSGLANN